MAKRVISTTVRDSEDKLGLTPEQVSQLLADTNVAKAKTKFMTEIDGGLIYSAMMKLHDAGGTGDEMAGISGIAGDDKEDPAFWAGGSYQDAIDNTAKAIIRHDGSSKFTDTEITGRVNAKSGVFTGALASPFDRAKPTSQYTNDFSNNIIVTGDEFFLPWTYELGSGRLIRLIQPNPGTPYCNAPSGFYFFEDGVQKTTLKMLGAEIIELLGYTDSYGSFVGWLVLNRGLMKTISTWGEPQRIVAQGRYKYSNPFKYYTFDGSEMTASIDGQFVSITMPEHWFDSKDGYYVKVFGNDGMNTAILAASNFTSYSFGVRQWKIDTSDNNKINLVTIAFNFFFEVHSAARLYGKSGSSGMPGEDW